MNLNIKGQHGLRFVLRHTHKPQRRPYPPVQTGAEKSDTGAEAVQPDPDSSWVGHFVGVSAVVGDESADFCQP